jgi:hypothetical protein
MRADRLDQLRRESGEEGCGAAPAIPTASTHPGPIRRAGGGPSPTEPAGPSLDRCDRGPLEIVEDATHRVQHEEPEPLDRLLIEFLGGESAGLSGPTRIGRVGVRMAGPLRVCEGFGLKIRDSRMEGRKRLS